MPAFCVPAYPKLVKFTQPDGTTVAYHIRGDEYSHWLESADGYVLKKSDKGFLCYATKDDNDTIVAGQKYTGDDRQAPATTAETQ